MEFNFLEFKQDLDLLFSRIQGITPKMFFDFLRQYTRRKDVVLSIKQDRLTRKYLMPYLDSIKKFFSYFRELYDEEIKKLQQQKSDNVTKKHPYSTSINEYPIGFCHLITDSVFKSVQKVGLESMFSKVFKTDEIVFKQIYVILDDKYFQNAMQLGSLYIDVANDTFDVKKEKIVVKHIRSVNYKNFRNYEIFAKVAEKYLNIKLYPNKYFPELYEIFPLIYFSKEYGYNFFDYNLSMFLRDMASDFNLSDKFRQSDFYKNNELPEEGIRFLSKFVENYSNFNLRELVLQVKSFKDLREFRERLGDIFQMVEQITQIPDKIYNSTH
ncbi:MAG: hypothetical protein Q9M37_07340 [Desulfonauticus sp.]|nr:hypothetical protein [Desulfonauticus sp.]